MNIYLVIASINSLANLKGLLENGNESTNDMRDITVIVIDEGAQAIRKHNSKILSGLAKVSFSFFGPKEREDWFKSHFGRRYRKYLSVIPERCHAETSFGFLVAYENGASITIEVDDDVQAVQGHNFVEGHLCNLMTNDGISVLSKNKWYNSLENLRLNTSEGEYPRGHPYAIDCREENYTWNGNGGVCALNMGLWCGAPDFDALTILYHGGLNGICQKKAGDLKREKIVVENGTFFAICSMNTAFQTRITPAFYQLYMNHMGIDRFDDIWSGLFLKKVADHLQDNMCLGAPLVYHDKRPRDTFKDLKKEMEGMIMNEKLWQAVDEAQLVGTNYTDAYLSLANELLQNLEKITMDPIQQKFMQIQVTKMKKWTEITDNL